VISDATVLYRIPENVKTRWASPENPGAEKGAGGKTNAGRKGSAFFPIKAGETKTLAAVSNTGGTVRRIWVTISDRSPRMIRGLRLDMYWDGEERPAVSAPLGDFFCHGMGRMNAFQNAVFSSPEGRSFNSCVPMPFRTGMKILVINESGTDLAQFFYDIDFTVGERHDNDTLYFHSHFQRENPTQLQKDYTILPGILGQGRFLGVNIGVKADKNRYGTAWWGEGEVKMYIDGDTDFPSLCGTGTEDYIGTGYGQGCYANLYQGCHLADHDKMQYCFYRMHIPDPVYFHTGIRVVMQQIGWCSSETRDVLKKCDPPILRAGAGSHPVDFSGANGQSWNGLFERQDDWSSCAYFYLDKPMSDLSACMPFDKRWSDDP